MIVDEMAPINHRSLIQNKTSGNLPLRKVRASQFHERSRPADSTFCSLSILATAKRDDHDHGKIGRERARARAINVPSFSLYLSPSHPFGFCCEASGRSWKSSSASRDPGCATDCHRSADSCSADDDRPIKCIQQVLPKVWQKVGRRV